MIENEDALAESPRHEIALSAIRAGIEASHPETVVPELLSVSGDTLSVGEDEYDLTDFERVVVLGGGNGAGRLAAALESLLGDSIDDGLVVTDDPAATRRVEVREGTHPLPSPENREATTELLERAHGLGQRDLALVALTGGGSALLCQPVTDLSVESYRDLTATLVQSGATIDEINAVRKHLSQVKGGRLAAALAPATVCSLILSDVVGNRLDVIASGPTTPDPTTYEDALAVLDEHDIDAPAPARKILAAGATGDRSETPVEGDAAFDRVETNVLADNRTALDAAAEVCSDAGYLPLILSSQIEGEASEVGTVHAGIVAECADSGTPIATPAAVLSGGETTVTVSGTGDGGPNQEFVLGASLGLDDSDALVAAVDTDGIDGTTDAAGGIVDATPMTAQAEARAALRDNDAYSYLDEQDALVRSGHTGTNVNDLRIILVGQP